MTLRKRVALALVLVVVPLALALALLGWRARREAMLEMTYAATVARMEAGGRERCEARGAGTRSGDDPGPPVGPRADDPPGLADERGALDHALDERGALDGALEDDPYDGPLGGAPGERGRRRRAARRERRGALAGSVVAAYDAELHTSDAAAAPLPDDVTLALRSGELAVLVAMPHGPPRVAVRMPWDDGPCAIVLVEPRRGTGRSERAAMRDLVVALGVLLSAVIAAMLALGPALRRLDLLASAVRASGAAGALAVPPAARGADEIGSLASALDDAAGSAREHLERIEARDRALRDYVDGTTHDIALPLTVLQSHLAGVAERANVGAPADARDVEGAVAASHYLGQLSANLAAAARLEASVPLERRPVDLGVVATRVTERLALIARHRHVEVACSAPDAPVLVDGDELLLERALANLVHNAIRHRPPASLDAPGHVAVLVDTVGGDPRVRVRSDGERISDAALQALRLGETLPDPGRTRGRGLGLRIVRQVARAHGLALSFERGEDGGLEVALGGATAGARVSSSANERTFC